MRPTINFFIEESKTHSNKNVFGLCDDDNSQPAYIDEDIANKNGKWIAQVINDSLKEIDFYPVDHCVEIKRADNTGAQRCEGILSYLDNNIIFTELKDRRAEWLTKAMEQIIETMSFFLCWFCWLPAATRLTPPGHVSGSRSPPSTTSITTARPTMTSRKKR